MNAVRLALRRFGDHMHSGPTGGIFGGMAKITLGNVMARSIGLLVLPVLTRLYSSEQFGLLATFSACLAFMAPIVTLRYANAIPLPRRDPVAMNLLVLSCLTMSVVTAGLTAVGLWAAGSGRLASFAEGRMTAYLGLIAVGVLGSAFYEIVASWSTRKRNYKLMAKSSVVQSINAALTKLALGLASLTSIGLIVGQIVSQCGGIFILTREFKQDFMRNARYVTRKRLLAVARTYSGFPKFRLPSHFVLSFAQQAPVFFVAAHYGLAVAGQLGVAKMLVSLPVSLLSNSLTSAAYGEIATINRQNPQQLLGILDQLVQKLLWASSAASILVFLFAPFVITTIFGAKWQEAGQFARYLSLYLVTAICAIPMSVFINVLKKQKEFLIVNALRLMLVGMVIAGSVVLALSPQRFILAYGLFMLLFQGVVILYTRKLVIEQNADVSKYV